MLKALGLANAVIRNGTQIERLYGKSCESGRTVLDVRYSDMREGGASGLGVHRAALFDALFQAVVDMGILIETDSEVQSSRLLPSGQRTLGLLDGREEEPFDLIVDALGSRSPLLKRSRRALPYGALWATVDWPANSGFEPAALEQRYRGARNMEGLLPIGRIPGDPKEKAAFFWSLKIDNLAAWEAARLQKLKRDILQIWPEISVVIDQLTVPNQLTFASYLHRTLSKPVEPNLIHIGDAWRSTSPQLGQGANMALLDAYWLASSLRGNPNVKAALRQTVQNRRRHVLLYQAMSWMFTPFYQSDSRVLTFFRDRIAGPIARKAPFPRLLAMIVSGGIGAPLRGRVPNLD